MFELETDLKQQDFTWGCTIGLVYPINHIKSAPAGKDDHEALASLRAIKRPEGAGLGQELVNGKFVSTACGEPGVDRVFFDNVTTDGHGRQLVHARVQLPMMSRFALIERLRNLRPVEITLPTNIEKRPMRHTEAYRNMVSSHHQETSFTVFHPRMRIVREHGGTVGLDAAWNVVFPARPSERCIYALSDVGASFRERLEVRDTLHLDQLRVRTVECRNRSRISISDQTLSIAKIPNKDLFAQIKAHQEAPLTRVKGPDGRVRKVKDVPPDFSNLLGATERHIMVNDIEGPGNEAERFRIVEEWMDQQGSSFSTKNSGTGVEAFFNGNAIGNWSSRTGHFTFDPQLDDRSRRSSGMISSKIESAEIPTAIAALILDAITARAAIYPDTHLASWLGSMADSFEAPHKLLAHQMLVGGVPVQIY